MDLGNLYELIKIRRRGTIIPKELLSFIMLNILKALKCLHSQNYYHRDIKPENILINRYGEVKLSDFGTTKEFIEEQQEVNDLQSKEQGTLAYQSPEVLSYESYSLQTDIWSVGITMHLLITGKHPYNIDERSTSRNEVYSKIIDQVPPKLDHSLTSKNELSKKLCQAINSCIVYDKYKRLTSENLLDQFFGKKYFESTYLRTSRKKLVKFIQKHKKD